jgi:hypothetical protein
MFRDKPKTNHKRWLIVANSNYGTEQIDSLEGLEAVRKLV